MALGQFTSADTANAGLNRYGYVKGNPETYTDPTGHRRCDDYPACTHGGGGTPPPSSHEKAPGSKETCSGIMLGGNCWLQGGGGKYDIYTNRVGFEQAFFAAYGNGWGQDWGKAEIAFTQWLISSGRIANSPFWRGVDAALLTDMYYGAYAIQNGTGHSDNSLVQGWIDFIDSPNLYTFWNAHNNSIFGNAFSQQGLS